MNIKILGTGCPKCNALTKVTQDSVSELGIKASIEKIEDIVEIMKYNVMMTPALVVDGNVVLKGKVPGKEELKKILAGA